ncbi:hypothetical protein HFO60_26900 [Rhizobium leguminosarum]|uniref:hypothetical protein n=1 Tax=Rhizobium leguminosarum TaxID=384 RepID=UPI001C98100B|nr:hypothetical protein [Rhizobium leguminosarum]MBY5524414.1 hypothetical protein [Rhizobium leguminosarum]MBY5543601.1 hypothetical protein [Rhizobium leguminosarum]
MPLTKTNTNNAIRGRIVPSCGQRNDCKAVIAQITFADLGRGAGTLHSVGVARVDMQGRTAAGDANIQVQMGGHTVAAAMIFNSVQQTTDPANQRGAANGTISVLNQSMDSGTVWNLTGTLP